MVLGNNAKYLSFRQTLRWSDPLIRETTSVKNNLTCFCFLTIITACSHKGDRGLVVVVVGVMDPILVWKAIFI